MENSDDVHTRDMQKLIELYNRAPDSIAPLAYRQLFGLLHTFRLNTHLSYFVSYRRCCI